MIDNQKNQLNLLEELKVEERELGKKIVKLNIQLVNSSNTLSHHDISLLSLQHSTMISYRYVLNLRISELISKLDSTLK